MTFKKRIIAWLLVIVLLLAGCESGQFSSMDDTTVETTADATDKTPKPSNSTNETIEYTKPEIRVTCQSLPETVENPDNLPVLKWVCLTFPFYGGGNRIWNEEAAVEVNQMLKDRNMPFRIQFVLLTTNGYLEDTMEWFTYPEAITALENADLIYGGMNAEAIVQYLSPITEHVIGTAEPGLQNAVAHELNWLPGTVDGEIYGYGTIPVLAYSNGWQIDPGLLNAAGLKAEDLQRNFWEMDEILAKLYTANGNQPFLYLVQKGVNKGMSMFGGTVPNFTIQSVASLHPQYYEKIVSFFAMDYSPETPAIINYLESDTTQKLVEAAMRYRAAGYATAEVEKARLVYGNVYGENIYTSSFLGGNICIPVSEAYYTESAPEGFVNGVAAASQYKAEAISLLNLIAEDAAFRMQLFYGKEGRDYIVENGYYSLIKHDDGSEYSLDFLSPLSYFCGLTADPVNGSSRSPGTMNHAWISAEGKTSLQTYQEIMDECEYYYPIRFDYTAIEQELAAMQDVLYNKYTILKSQPLTETIRQHLVTDLKAAGSDKVLAELQQQLTAWQKNHPNWPDETVD